MDSLKSHMQEVAENLESAYEILNLQSEALAFLHKHYLETGRPAGAYTIETLCLDIDKIAASVSDLREELCKKLK